MRWPKHAPIRLAIPWIPLIAASTPALENVLSISKLGNRSPVSENMSFLFQSVSLPARNGNRPEIPIHNSQDKTSTGQQEEQQQHQQNLHGPSHNRIRRIKHAPLPPLPRPKKRRGQQCHRQRHLDKHGGRPGPKRPLEPRHLRP